ncbi:hypothetical protein GCM10009565_08010 [Amycolatopsis albidoflavus]
MVGGRIAKESLPPAFDCTQPGIVQEVDGQNDFGEDQLVTFTENGEVTGGLVEIQVVSLTWPGEARPKPSPRANRNR